MKTQLQSLRPVLFNLILSLSIPLATKAQVNININLQPAWGPVGYDYVEYYYLPEYEVYYYVPSHRFVYLDGGRWVFGASLPSRYGIIDYYSTYKVVINKPRAYHGFYNHRVHYAKYKHGGHSQIIIRDDHSPKYSRPYGGRNQRIQGNQPQSRPRSNSPQGNQQKGGGRGNGGRKH
ncbi:MAG: hypothetical protein V4651_00670 [Bacteroidota bacterium]